MERVTDGTETSIPEIRIRRSRAKRLFMKMMRYKEALCLLLTSVIVFLAKSGKRLIKFWSFQIFWRFIFQCKMKGKDWKKREDIYL